LVVIDLETTGFKHKSHKIVEIGCVEIIDGKITGKELQI